MFPTTRLGQFALAAGTLIVSLAVVLPPITFRLTDLGIAHHGVGFALGSNDARVTRSSGTVLHVGACKFVGQSSICSHKELLYDHAHGLRFVASVNSRPPSGL